MAVTWWPLFMPGRSCEVVPRMFRITVGHASGSGFTSLKERAVVKGWYARFSSGSGPGCGHAVGVGGGLLVPAVIC
jgi:hypothetical protein